MKQSQFCNNFRIRLNSVILDYFQIRTSYIVKMSLVRLRISAGHYPVRGDRGSGGLDESIRVHSNGAFDVHFRLCPLLLPANFAPNQAYRGHQYADFFLTH